MRNTRYVRTMIIKPGVCRWTVKSGQVRGVLEKNQYRNVWPNRFHFFFLLLRLCLRADREYTFGKVNTNIHRHYSLSEMFSVSVRYEFQHARTSSTRYNHNCTTSEHFHKAAYFHVYRPREVQISNMTNPRLENVDESEYENFYSTTFQFQMHFLSTFSSFVKYQK